MVINILNERLNSGFTFPIYLTSSVGTIECIVKIFLKEDIDGEGWVCGVTNNSLEEVQKNKGFNFKLLGVNTILEKVEVSYSYEANNKNETWSKVYNNCISSISREELNYSNLQKAIFISDYGKGQAIDFNLFLDTDLEDITYEKYGVDNQKKYFTDPDTWTLSSLNKSKDKVLQKVVHDLKREMVAGEEGISNGYIGFADIAKKAQKFYIGIDGKAKSITKIYVGDMNGKAKLFYSNSGGVSINVPLEVFDYEEHDSYIILKGYFIEQWKLIFNNSYIYIPNQINNKDIFIGGYFIENSSIYNQTLSFAPNIKFVNNDMSHAFSSGGSAVYRIYNLPEDIIDAESAFAYSNINHNIKLPSTLQNVAYLFNSCHYLNQKNLKVQFENVTNAARLFCGCNNLCLETPVILNGQNVYNIDYAFGYVKSVGDVTFGNNIRHASGVFDFYVNLNGYINIGNDFNTNTTYLTPFIDSANAKNLKGLNIGNNFKDRYTFYWTNNFNCPITIGSNANIGEFFYVCRNFSSNITIRDNANIQDMLHSSVNYSLNFTIGNNANLNTLFSSCANFSSNIIIGDNANINSLYSFGGTLHPINVIIGSNANINNISHGTVFNGSITIGSNANISNIFGNSTSSFNGTIDIKNNSKYIGSIFANSDPFFNSKNIFLGNNIYYLDRFLFGCGAYNQNIQFPNNISFVNSVFAYCRSFNQNVLFPDTIQGSFNNIFACCSSLNQNIRIPKNVEYMNSTFEQCTSLNQNILIPSNVKHLGKTFHTCHQMNDKNIYVLSSKVNYAYNMLGTSRNDNAKINVFIPSEGTTNSYIYQTSLGSQSKSWILDSNNNCYYYKNLRVFYWNLDIDNNCFYFKDNYVYFNK